MLEMTPSEEMCTPAAWAPQPPEPHQWAGEGVRALGFLFTVGPTGQGRQSFPVHPISPSCPQYPYWNQRSLYECSYHSRGHWKSWPLSFQLQELTAHTPWPQIPAQGALQDWQVPGHACVLGICFPCSYSPAHSWSFAGSLTWGWLEWGTEFSWYFRFLYLRLDFRILKGHCGMWRQMLILRLCSPGAQSESAQSKMLEWCWGCKADLPRAGPHCPVTGARRVRNSGEMGKWLWLRPSLFREAPVSRCSSFLTLTLWG